MYCRHCGQKIDNPRKYCAQCGCELAQGNHIQTPPRRVRPANGMGRKLAYVVVGLVVIAAGLFRLGVSTVNTMDSKAVEQNDEGLAAFQSGDRSEAIEKLSEAADSAITRENKLNTLLNLAYVYSSEQRMAEARATFLEARKHASSLSMEAFLIDGEIDYIDGHPELALKNYEAAHKRVPESFQANNALNLFYLDMNERYPEYFDSKKAVSYAIAAYEDSSAELNVMAAQNLGIAYYMNDQYEEAVKFLELGNNGEPYMHYWLGLCYAALDESEMAVKYFREAIEGGIEPDEAVIQYLEWR